MHTQDVVAGADVASKVNFPSPDRVMGSGMITTAIVFGMVGIAAGFTWEYVIKQGE